MTSENYKRWFYTTTNEQQPVRVEWRWKWGPFVDDVDNHGFRNKELPSENVF